MIAVIADIPPSLNRFAGRKNAWEYREQKQIWKELVYYAVLPVRPAKPYEKSVVTITYHFKDKRRRDPDNFSGKMIMDGLTAAKVISDDSFSNIELHLAGVYDGKNQTVIDVKEV